MQLSGHALLLSFALASAACSSPPPPPRLPAEAAAPTRLEGVDLLHTTPTTVTASSVFRDEGGSLVLLADGDTETAWSSREGEMAGAFIEVSLPEDARVSGFSMTVGFTREGKPDVFHKNPRIARVSVSHNGVAVQEYDLDVESRAMQTIPIEGPGGVYRIDVLDVVRSVRPDSARVFVTELRVWGVPSTVVESEPTFTYDGERPPGSAYDDDEGPVWYLPEPVSVPESRATIAAFAQRWSVSDASEEEFVAAAVQVSGQINSMIRCEWYSTLLRVRQARFARQLDRWIASERQLLNRTQERDDAIHRVEMFRARVPVLTPAQTVRTRPPEGETFAARWNEIRSSTVELRLTCGVR
jgi:hypothetical protein